MVSKIRIVEAERALSIIQSRFLVQIEGRMISTAGPRIGTYLRIVIILLDVKIVCDFSFLFKSC